MRLYIYKDDGRVDFFDFGSTPAQFYSSPFKDLMMGRVVSPIKMSTIPRQSPPQLMGSPSMASMASLVSFVETPKLGALIGKVDEVDALLAKGEWDETDMTQAAVLQELLSQRIVQEKIATFSLPMGWNPSPDFDDKEKFPGLRLSELCAKHKDLTQKIKDQKERLKALGISVPFSLSHLTH